MMAWELPLAQAKTQLLHSWKVSWAVALWVLSSMGGNSQLCLWHISCLLKPTMWQLESKDVQRDWWKLSSVLRISLHTGVSASLREGWMPGADRCRDIIALSRNAGFDHAKDRVSSSSKSKSCERPSQPPRQVEVPEWP